MTRTVFEYVTYKCGHKRHIIYSLVVKGCFTYKPDFLSPELIDCPLCQDKKHPTIVRSAR